MTTTSVIEELEKQDTSFVSRFKSTVSKIEAVEQWIRSTIREIDSNRSTSASYTMENCFSDTFTISVITTKKAISEKRFDGLLSTPPVGWCLMGMNKDRKEAELIAQYVRVDDYSVSASEINHQYIIGEMENLTETIEELRSESYKSRKETAERIINNNSYNSNRDIENMKSHQVNIDWCKSILEKLGGNFATKDITQLAYIVYDLIWVTPNPTGHYQYSNSRLWGEWLTPQGTFQSIFKDKDAFQSRAYLKVAQTI